MRKPRHLSPEDRALWETVARRVEPLHPKLRESVARTKVKATPASEPKEAIPPFEVGSKSTSLPGIGQSLKAAPVRMDSKAFGKMKRGKIAPEARIDLHGMTLDEAHPALTDFILRAANDGKRLVLVITGKGRGSGEGWSMPGRVGVLRHQVPQWLRLPPLVSQILEVRPAHRRHGGDGAFYVYLRKSRR